MEQKIGYIATLTIGDGDGERIFDIFAESPKEIDLIRKDVEYVSWDGESMSSSVASITAVSRIKYFLED